MKPIELERQLRKSPRYEWAGTLSITFNFENIGDARSLKGYSAIYRFIYDQARGWEKLIQGRQSKFQKNLIFFKELEASLIHFYNTYLVNENGSNNSWNSIEYKIRQKDYDIIPYDNSVTEFLVGLEVSRPIEFESAQKFLLRKSDYNLTNSTGLTGALLAYEFLMQGQSDIIKRRDAEKKSIESIRSDFNRALNKYNETLDDFIKRTNTSYDDFTSSFEEQSKSREESFNDWFSNTKEKEWGAWYQQTNERIAELEETYQEKLKLSEPAKYWSDRALVLNKRGWNIVWTIVPLVVTVCISLFVILWNPPSEIMNSWFGGDKSAAIRWSLIYITFLSFIAYLIRALTKVMFSCFHLARDCEERHTLTYFYLALLKDSNVGDEQKQLIMQSLFSRADTGLLKEDSSPTMPNDMVRNILLKKD
jgi:hypothetical protein